MIQVLLPTAPNVRTAMLAATAGTAIKSSWERDRCIRAASQGAPNIHTPVVVGSVHREPGRQIQTQWAKVILCIGGGLVPWIAFGDAQTLLAQSLARCLEQALGDTATAVTRLDQETDDGSDLRGIRNRLVIQRMEQRARS